MNKTPQLFQPPSAVDLETKLTKNKRRRVLTGISTAVAFAAALAVSGCGSGIKPYWVYGKDGVSSASASPSPSYNDNSRNDNSRNDNSRNDSSRNALQPRDNNSGRSRASDSTPLVNPPSPNRTSRTDRTSGGGGADAVGGIGTSKDYTYNNWEVMAVCIEDQVDGSGRPDPRKFPEEYTEAPENYVIHKTERNEELEEETTITFLGLTPRIPCTLEEKEQELHIAYQYGLFYQLQKLKESGQYIHLFFPDEAPTENVVDVVGQMTEMKLDYLFVSQIGNGSFEELRGRILYRVGAAKVFQNIYSGSGNLTVHQVDMKPPAKGSYNLGATVRNCRKNNNSTAAFIDYAMRKEENPLETEIRKLINTKKFKENKSGTEVVVIYNNTTSLPGSFPDQDHRTISFAVQKKLVAEADPSNYSQCTHLLKHFDLNEPKTVSRLIKMTKDLEWFQEMIVQNTGTLSIEDFKYLVTEDAQIYAIGVYDKKTKDYGYEARQTLKQNLGLKAKSKRVRDVIRDTFK